MFVVYAGARPGRESMFLRWTVRKLAKPKRGEMKVVKRRSGKRTGPMITLAHWRPDEDSEWRQDISWSANIVTCRRLNGKPRQLHLHTFGPISDSEIALVPYRCRDFWQNVDYVLRRRLLASPGEIERITQELE